MNQYHKIQSVWLRDPNDRYKTFLEQEWAKPEFKMLENIDWIWTEKIDGTNIRVMWDGNQVRFGGKTERANIPAHLVAKLQDLFTNEKMKEVFNKHPQDDTPPICLYGEGYGKKIQKGGNYIPDDVNFILFDIKVGNWWLTRDVLEELAQKLQIDIVPIVGIGPLCDAIKMVRKGFTSRIADNKEYIAEGLIVKPRVELFNRQGARIVSKIKHKDFKR